LETFVSYCQFVKETPQIWILRHKIYGVDYHILDVTVRSRIRLFCPSSE